MQNTLSVGLEGCGSRKKVDSNHDGRWDGDGDTPIVNCKRLN